MTKFVVGDRVAFTAKWLKQIQGDYFLSSKRGTVVKIKQLKGVPFQIVVVEWEGDNAVMSSSGNNLCRVGSTEFNDPGAPGTALEQKADLMSDQERNDWIERGMP